MKRKPKEGEVWRDSDNEIVYIIKCYLNSGYQGTNHSTYKIVEYTNEDSLNIMECSESNLVEFIGYPPCPVVDFFKKAEK